MPVMLSQYATRRLVVSVVVSVKTEIADTEAAAELTDAKTTSAASKTFAATDPKVFEARFSRPANVFAPSPKTVVRPGLKNTSDAAYASDVKIHDTVPARDVFDVPCISSSFHSCWTVFAI
jgi:hypothetical protein